jgi:hypothetical protein
MVETGTLDINCESCGATLILEPHLRTAECPYCDSPAVIERPTSEDRPEPAFVVGFIIDQARALKAVRRWIRSRGLFAHSGLKKATIAKTRAVYLPTYLYGGVAKTAYEADIGEYYWETETYTTTDSEGNTVTRTRTVRRTEWRNLRGRHETYVLDVVVTASNGITNEQLASVEPFDLRSLRRYTPAVLSGWIAEEPSLGQEACLQMARAESIELIGAQLSDFMPGDTYSDLRYSTDMHDEVIDLVLLPVWVFAARFAPDKPPVRIILNGQTGKISGRVPRSWKKIVGTVIIAAAIGVLAYLLISGF